jgi:hypothetical protein
MRRRAQKRRRTQRRPRTEWHPPFGALIEWRRPSWIAVVLEALLQRQSQRVDILLLRRTRAPQPGDEEGRVLRSLWRHVERVALLEFKSVARLFAPGDLYRLCALGWHWLARNPGHTPAEVLLVLVIPDLTDTLRQELDRCPASLVEAEPGYHHASVLGMRLIVVVLDVASESERDDYLRVFSHHPIQTEEVVDWLREHTDLSEDAVLSPEEVAKNEPMLIKLAKSLPLQIRLKDLKPEERLAGLQPEERLAGLQPEERLAGLQPEERLAGLQPEDLARALSEADRVLALPDAALRGLPADYLATLPEAAQQRIRERLGR